MEADVPGYFGEIAMQPIHLFDPRPCPTSVVPTLGDIAVTA
jgi:hypothetical protein